PGSPCMAMYSPCNTPCGVGFPIRTLPEQSLLPAPRHFSQAATSFTASDRQCIHRVRLFAGPYKPMSPRRRCARGYKSLPRTSNDSNDRYLAVPALASRHVWTNSSQTLATFQFFNEHGHGFSAGPNQIFVCAIYIQRWWVWEDSNHRPHPYQGCALTT